MDVTALYQAAKVSVASQGLNIWKLGSALHIAACSIGSCVGPSSPTPILSCVKMKAVGIFISEASLAMGFV